MNSRIPPIPTERHQISIGYRGNNTMGGEEGDSHKLYDIIIVKQQRRHRHPPTHSLLESGIFCNALFIICIPKPETLPTTIAVRPIVDVDKDQCPIN
jgi:hypothetical protein